MFSATIWTWRSCSSRGTVKPAWWIRIRSEPSDLPDLRTQDLDLQGQQRPAGMPSCPPCLWYGEVAGGLPSRRIQGAHWVRRRERCQMMAVGRCTGQQLTGDSTMGSTRDRWCWCWGTACSGRLHHGLRLRPTGPSPRCAATLVPPTLPHTSVHVPPCQLVQQWPLASHSRSHLATPPALPAFPCQIVCASNRRPSLLITTAAVCVASMVAAVTGGRARS